MLFFVLFLFSLVWMSSHSSSGLNSFGLSFGVVSALVSAGFWFLRFVPQNDSQGCFFLGSVSVLFFWLLPQGSSWIIFFQVKLKNIEFVFVHAFWDWFLAEN